MKKNIVIAGASAGIGGALAGEYVKQGHQVFGCGRRSKINLNGMRYQSVDLSDSDKVGSWVDNILAEVPHIELCLNCTGSLSSGKMLWEFDAKETQSMIDANVIVLINVLRHLGLALYILAPRYATMPINQVIFWSPSGLFEIMLGIWLLSKGLKIQQT